MSRSDAINFFNTNPRPDAITMQTNDKYSKEHYKWDPNLKKVVYIKIPKTTETKSENKSQEKEYRDKNREIKTETRNKKNLQEGISKILKNGKKDDFNGEILGKLQDIGNGKYAAMSGYTIMFTSDKGDMPVNTKEESIKVDKILDAYIGTTKSENKVDEITIDKINEYEAKASQDAELQQMYEGKNLKKGCPFPITKNGEIIGAVNSANLKIFLKANKGKKIDIYLSNPYNGSDKKLSSQPLLITTNRLMGNDGSGLLTTISNDRFVDWYNKNMKG